MNKFKVLKSAAKAILPFSARLRRVARAIRPYRDNPANTHFALTQGLVQIRMLRSVGANLSGTILEFGSGWVPVIPLLFHLAGSRHVILTDIERLMDAKTIQIGKQAILERAAEVAAAFDMPETEIYRRIETGFKFEYLVPWNSREHPPNTVDIIVSRTVLELFRLPAWSISWRISLAS